jgi:hypothetical protein
MSMKPAYVTDASSDNGMVSSAETYADFGKGSVGKCAYWKAEIKACDKETATWREQSVRVVNRYRDDRKSSGLGLNDRKYNMLWSIIRTTMPAVYGKPPSPIVMRRFTDPDQVARVAAMMLERCLDFQISFQSDFHHAIKNALEDRLLPGMGCAWVRYQKAQTSPTGTIDNDYYARLSGNVAAVDYVYWEDFGFVPSRTWEEVPAVWRIVYMNRDQLVERFPKVGEQVPLDYVPARHPSATNSTAETDEPKNHVFQQAKVYEIWDKRTSTVCWVSMAMSDLLDERKDPINFPGFFPCPKPLFATNTTGNLTPVPDYVMYQDQAYEIDNLTQRLNMLVKACKVVGIYNSDSQGIPRMLTEGVDNQLIPVDTWAAHAESGGIKGNMELLPLEVISDTITKLFEVRQQLIQDIYQITGLSDIIRGASNPNETLGAQKLKAQFASVRLDALKMELARFVTDILRLMGHIMVEFFDDKTLTEQSAILQSPDGQKAIKDAQQAMTANQPAPPPMAPPAPPPPGGMLPAPPPGGNVMPFPGAAPPPVAPPTQQNIIEAALKLLKQGKLADYRIEVAADTLIEPDLDAERDARNQFITGITQFMQQAMPAVQQQPQLLPVVKELMLFGIRGFRNAKSIEGIIEASFDEMQANPTPPPPDPKAEALKMKGQLDQQKAQSDVEVKQQEMQMEMAKMQAEMASDRERNAMEMQALREKTQAEVQAILIKAQVQAQVARDKAASDAEAKAVAVQSDVEARAQEMELKGAEHEQSLEQSAEAHDASLEQQEAAAKQKKEAE